MLNILSTTEKKKILTEYRLRLAVVSIFAVGSLILASLVLLAPSYFLAISKYNDANNMLEVLEGKNGREGQEKDVNKQIAAINKNVDLFLKAGTPGALLPSSVVTKILNTKGSAIKIISFTYDASPTQERIVVAGSALDREKLAEFIEALKKDPAFTSVDIPISSYVKSSNIEFSAVIIRGAKK